LRAENKALKYLIKRKSHPAYWYKAYSELDKERKEAVEPSLS
jgi:hypothetical protein